MNSGNIEFQVDRIIILSSLNEGDIGVVTRLLHNLEDLFERTKAQIVLDYFEISDRSDFERLILKIALEVQTCGIPLLHLEMHGELNKGLKLTSGEIISWSYLSHLLGLINKPTRNKMMVLSSACFSLETIAHFNISKPSPFSYFTAPSRKITNGYLEDHLIKFYEQLIKRSSIEKIQASLGPKFHHHFPEDFAFYIVRDEIRSLSSNKNREKSVTTVKSQLVENGAKTDLREIRKRVKSIEKGLTNQRLNALLSVFLCGRAPYFSADDIRKSSEDPFWLKLVKNEKSQELPNDNE